MGVADAQLRLTGSKKLLLNKELLNEREDGGAGINNASLWSSVAGLGLTSLGFSLQRADSSPSPFFQTTPGSLRDEASLLVLPYFSRCPMPVPPPCFLGSWHLFWLSSPRLGRRYGLRPQLHLASRALSLPGEHSPSWQASLSLKPLLSQAHLRPFLPFTL